MSLKFISRPNFSTYNLTRNISVLPFQKVNTIAKVVPSITQQALKFTSRINPNFTTKKQTVRSFTSLPTHYEILQSRPKPKACQTLFATTSFSSSAALHNWQRQRKDIDRRRKAIPKLIYLHNPWKYFVTKFNLLTLRMLWDRDFKETEFIRGSKQAAIVLTNIIRNSNANEIVKLTTPIGFQQIQRDMMLSRNDNRLKLVKFEQEHLRKAIPMRVARRENFGRKYCFIDMLFVGLRNTKDFDSPEEAIEINEVLRKLDDDAKMPRELLAPHRIVFAEIFIRFRRDYSEKPDSRPNKIDDNGWSVSFYKILTFDVLNYDPKQ